MPSFHSFLQCLYLCFPFCTATTFCFVLASFYILFYFLLISFHFLFYFLFFFIFISISALNCLSMVACWDCVTSDTKIFFFYGTFLKVDQSCLILTRRFQWYATLSFLRRRCQASSLQSLPYAVFRVFFTSGDLNIFSQISDSISNATVLLNNTIALGNRPLFAHSIIVSIPHWQIPPLLYVQQSSITVCTFLLHSTITRELIINSPHR